MAFDRICELSGLPRPIPEYRFSPPRRWRFDWAWPAVQGGGLALEKQGGLFIQGRHSRGAALLQEHEKLNEAAAQGWGILYTTPDQLESAALLNLIRRALNL